LDRTQCKLTTANTAGSANDCDSWRYVNEDGNPGNVYSGRFGVGGNTSLSDNFSSGESLCSATKRIICVQQ
jgi:hypothetical protein